MRKEKDMDELLTKIRKHWNDTEKLQLILLDIVELHLEENKKYGAAIRSEASLFLTEKSGGYNMTVTEAEKRAKATAGGIKELHKGNLQALELLYEAVKERVDVSVYMLLASGGDLHN